MTSRGFRRWALAIVAAAMAMPASAEVIVIDPSVFEASSRIEAGRVVQFDVVLVRFLPRDKTRVPDVGSLTNAPLSQFIAGLGKQGQVNLLYVGNRDLCGASGAPVVFDSCDKRPAFSLDKATNDVLTNRVFGLSLRVQAERAANERVSVSWNGWFAWSPTILDAGVGEKFLQFGFKVAKLLKPGMVFEDSDDEDDEESGPGINIGALFKKKKPPEKKALTAEQISYLQADRQEVSLNNSSEFGNGEQRILCLPTPDQNEYIFFILRPSW